MAPVINTITPRDVFNPGFVADQFRTQWVNPSDVFSILLILGGDIVSLALAQLAGSGFTPVAFSFGWVAYSISALVSALGANVLMPQSPDYDCKVINGGNGFVRQNSSWVLGRMMRDFEHWMHPQTLAKTQRNIRILWNRLRETDISAKEPSRAGLVVTVYQPSRTAIAGRPKKDLLYWSGVVTIFVQLGIAAIPLGLFGDWSILLITVSGTSLAVATGFLPQWKAEKWACRRGAWQTYIVTEGNGAQHAVVILPNGHGLDLEDLATGQSTAKARKGSKTWIVQSIFAVLWILLLITATGLKRRTWYLLAVGGLGIVQNVIVAGWVRTPENFGIPLQFVEVLGQPSVMKTLFSVEEKYRGVGKAMLGEFFPGELSAGEKAAWEEFDRIALEKRSSFTD
ncbi:hypothetical protein BGZ63DRAFT_362815 [Mariannaea sp. PMI_226]|nr:hypothetical protein BGZ63DRAFT_362815 [Mariannaea sp. PMI_226]